MDQPNVWRVRIFSMVSGVAGVLIACCPAPAQELPAPSGGGSFFSRDLGTALRVDYNSEYYGTDKGVVAIGGMKVFNGDASTWFIDAQGTLSDDFGGGYNAGIGYRVLGDTLLPYDSERIHGVSLWSDGQSTSADNWFNQLGVSLESMGDKWDARLSGYFPLSRSKTGDPVVGSLDDPFYEGFRLLSSTEVVPIDTALTVVDGEVAHRLMNLEAWAFLGGYHLGGGGFDDGGYRAGFRGYAVPDLQVTVQVSDDDIYGTNVSAGITWFVGRTHRANQPVGNILDRLREPVLRNDFIATAQRFESTGTGPLTDNTTSEELAFIHVDSGDGSAMGDGSFENPFSDLDQVPVGNEDAIILVHGGSTLGSGHTFENGQRLLGEGLDADMVPVVHTVNTSELGLINLPETAAGASSLARPMVSGVAGDVFTMADNNELNNFDVDGGAQAIVASMKTGIVASNLALTNQTGTATVNLDTVTGNNIIDNSVIIDDAAGIGLRVVNSSGLLGATANVQATGGRAVVIEGWGGGAATFGQIGEDDTTANTGGVLAQNNTGGTITFSSLANIDTSGTGDEAVELLNNTGATITFEDLRATNDTTATLLVQGEGTVNINNTGGLSEIENTGAGTAVSIDGDAATSIAANIDSNGAGLAVQVENRTANNANFTGLVGDGVGVDGGVLIQNVSGGTVGFGDVVTVNESNNTGVDITGVNTGGRFTFNGLDITTNGQSGFRITGGGTLAASNALNPSTVNVTGAAGTTGVEVDDTTIDPIGLNFDTVNVTGGDNGVVLTDNDGGAIVIGSDATTPGNISNTTANAILVDGGSSNVTVNTTANVAAGSLLSVQNRLGAGTTTTIAGDLTATGGSGVGISSNGGGTVSVTGDVNVNTGASDAFTVSNNVGSTAVNVSGDVSTTTTTGDGVVVTNNSSTAAIDFSGDVTATTTSGDGIVLSGNSGTSTTSFTGDVTLNTGAGAGVNFNGNSGTYAATFTGSTTNNLSITASTGSGISAGGGGELNVVGNTVNRNTISTAGVGINLTNSQDVQFSFTDVASTAALAAVRIAHSDGNVSQNQFSNVRVTDGQIGFQVLPAGIGELDVEIDNATVTGVNAQGILLNATNGSGRVDFTLADSSVTAGDSEAVSLDFDNGAAGAGTGEARLLLQGNTLVNSSAASSTLELAIDADRLVSATIGTGAPPVVAGSDANSNSITNTLAGTPVNIVTNDTNGSAPTLNLDLRSNAAFGGGGVQYQLTQSNTSVFNSVDHANVGANNVGTVNDAGTITDIPGPVAQPTPIP